MRLFSRRTLLVISWALIGAAGVAAGWWGSARQRENAARDLTEDARRCALAFDGESLRRLNGTPSDLASPAYLAVKTRLVRLRQVSPDVLAVRLVRARPAAGQLVLLADSEPPNSRHISNPGDEVPVAMRWPALHARLLATGAATEGPRTGPAGTWVRGYATVDEGLSAPAATTETDILALDLSAGRWQRDRWMAGVKTAAWVWVILGIPLAGLVVVRRQRRQWELVHRLNQAVEQSRAGVAISLPDRRIEYVNAGLCAITGWRRGELIGQPLPRLFASGDGPEEQAQEILATIEAGRTWRGESNNRRRDGSTYPARCVAAPLHDAAGRLTHVITVVEDVTERKQVEATLVYAKERAEAGERAKGQFLTMMSHEIRTPLNGIIGFTDLLLDTPLVPEQREYLMTIRNSGESLLQLASDVLDFSRIDAGRLNLEPQPCSPLEILETVLELFAAHAAERHLELLHSLGDGVPPAVLVDAARLRQILVNLVGNAIKFTRAGEVEVTVQAERRSPAETGDAATAAAPRLEPGWRLTFAVRDTGIGIAEADRGKLFKPFSQIDSSSTRKYGGAGLGLAISRSLVQMMGGEIALAGEVGKGTTFTFTVLAGDVSVPARPDGLPDLAGLNGRTVAVVSASPSLGRELARLTAAWGARAVECTHERLAVESWDLAVVDVTVASAQVWRGIFAQRPELATRPMVGLIPVNFPAPDRADLGRCFRALIRKPARHQALGMLLEASLQPTISGLAIPMGGTIPAVGLGLAVLLVDGNPVNQRVTQKMLENLGCHWDLAEDGRLALSRLDRGNYDLVLLVLELAEGDGFAVIEQIRRGRAGGRNRDIWITAVASDQAEAQRVLTVTGGANDCLTQPVRPAELEAALRRGLTGRSRSS